jgi:hypothetical protein
MLVSGICQKILVERLDKFPEPPTGEGYLSSLSTIIFWQIPLTTTAGGKISCLKIERD